MKEFFKSFFITLIIILTVGIIFLFLAGPFPVLNYFYEKEKIEKSEYTKEEIKELKEFQKQWNKDLPKLKERIEKGEFDNIEPEDSKWERYKTPYDKSLPEFPDMEENDKTLLGIDSNNNGVRDDLEVLTVKEFWNDKDVIEVVFAGIRANDYDIYIYENNLINYDNIQKVIDNIEGCSFWMTGNFDQDRVYNKYFNTLERRKVEKEIMKNFKGHIGNRNTITKSFCQTKIEESKKWIYRKK